MENSTLNNEIRKLFEKGEKIISIKEKLKEKGYEDSEVNEEINNFLKDEETDFDDRLVRIIEKRCRKGELLQDIMEDLEKKGNKPYMIEKALLRASTNKTDFFFMLKGWEIYTYIQILVLIITVILGFTYSLLFFLGTVFMIFEMGISSANISSKNFWMPEIQSVVPGMGFTITQGYFGYNKVIGNYFRWWMMDPSIVTLISFSSFGFIMLRFYGINFFIAWLSLGILSFVSFFLKPKEN
jgi:hypothetical protein